MISWTYLTNANSPPEPRPTTPTLGFQPHFVSILLDDLGFDDTSIRNGTVGSLVCEIDLACANAAISACRQRTSISPPTCVVSRPKGFCLIATTRTSGAARRDGRFCRVATPYTSPEPRRRCAQTFCHCSSPLSRKSWLPWVRCAVHVCPIKGSKTSIRLTAANVTALSSTLQCIFL